MNNVEHPLWNCTYGPPAGLEESQVSSAKAFRGVVPGPNSLEGSVFTSVAWKPTPEELAELNNGGLVYLTVIGGLMPHFLTTDIAVSLYNQS